MYDFVDCEKELISRCYSCRRRDACRGSLWQCSLAGGGAAEKERTSLDFLGRRFPFCPSSTFLSNHALFANEVIDFDNIVTLWSEDKHQLNVQRRQEY